MKCKDKKCRCGQDLTGIDVEPTMWTLVDGKRVPYVECPRCLNYCFLVEPVVAVKPVLKPKVEKAKVTEKQLEPKA